MLHNMAKRNVPWMNERFSIRFGSTTYTGAPAAKLGLVEPAAYPAPHVIMANNREYNGGPGYGGRLCLRANVVPLKVYPDAASADRARVLLGMARVGGGSFRVVPWRP